jgi:pimeloyl-ACP methyl ester carboxylesterase
VQIKTRYTARSGAHIAYQVLGRGPDLLLIPGLISHLDLDWEDTAYRSFVRRLSRLARVARYDKRGTGLSDPMGDVPTVEERAADAFAVLDAIGSWSRPAAWCVIRPPRDLGLDSMR